MTKNFVDSVVKDPANPPNVKLVVGYLGKSATEGMDRIYTNVELSEHIDVPHGAILHSQDVPDDHFGAKYFWVNRSADVTIRNTARSELKTKFMSGPLAESAAESESARSAATNAAFANVASVNQLCPTPSFNPGACPSEPIRCPSVLGDCPSIDTICPTLPPVNCPVVTKVGCPTRTLHCPSRIERCPSVFDGACQQISDLICPTHQVNCQITRPLICHVTGSLQCIPTIRGCITVNNCTSAVDACPSAMCVTVFGPFM